MAPVGKIPVDKDGLFVFFSPAVLDVEKIIGIVRPIFGDVFISQPLVVFPAGHVGFLDPADAVKVASGIGVDKLFVDAAGAEKQTDAVVGPRNDQRKRASQSGKAAAA